MIVALDTSSKPMSARVIQQYSRPDGKLTNLRGNTQVLPDGGAFISWSTQGYLSEYAADGRCILEAEFLSPRFNTYRAYKFNFTGFPEELPMLKVYAYEVGLLQWGTAFHVSWNGATEVAKWKFYSVHEESSELVLLGSAKKQGFETSFMSTINVGCSWAEAISENGTVLGKSATQMTTYPNGQVGVCNKATTVHHGVANLDTAQPSAIPEICADVVVHPKKFRVMSFRDIAGIFIILPFAAVGLARIMLFVWHRRAWISRGTYRLVRDCETVGGRDK